MAARYTLKDFYDEAKLEGQPPWADKILVTDPTFGGEMRPSWDQILGLNLAFSYDNQRAGIFDDMGSGKTLICQAWTIWHAAAGNKVVCLMSRGLLQQFKNSFLKTFEGIENCFVPEIYYGDKKKRDKIVDRWSEEGAPSVVITTYDLFRSEYMVFKAFEYSALMSDEAKILGNPENKCYDAVLRFMEEPGVRAALAMIGTPAGAQLYRLYGYMNFLTPGVYKSREHFDELHVTYIEVDVTLGKIDTARTKKISIIKEYRNLELMYYNLYRQARRIEKPPGPGKELITRSLNLDDKHYDQYLKLAKERLLEFPDGSILDATASASLRTAAIQSVVHPEKIGIKGESAIFAAMDEVMSEGELEGSKWLLMAHHRETVEKVAKYYAKLNPAVIYGATKNSEAEKQKFINDPDCKVCVINYQSSAGIDGFQRVAWNAIAVEPGVISDFDQTVDRLDRRGQEHRVKVFMMCPEGTIYVPKLKSMTKNRQVIRSVVSREAMLRELSGVAEEPSQAEEEAALDAVFDSE